MLNGEKLMYRLLTQAIAGTQDAAVTLMPAIDADAYDRLPLVTFMLSGGNELENGLPKPTSWEFSLSLTLLDTDIEAAGDRAARFYDYVHAWNDPWAGKNVVTGVGGAMEVTDDSLFTRTGTVEIDGKGLVQMDAGFGLILFEE